MGSTPAGGSGNSFSEFFLLENASLLLLLYPSHQKNFWSEGRLQFLLTHQACLPFVIFFLPKIMVGPSPPLDPPLQKYSSRQAGVFLLHMVN